jgi:hypothetical protein
VPYETWSFFAHDPRLRLTPEESKELADSYYVLAQAYEPDFSKPFWLIPTIAMSHVGLIAERMVYLNEKEKKAKNKKNEKENGEDSSAIGLAAELVKDLKSNL